MFSNNNFLIYPKWKTGLRFWQVFIRNLMWMSRFIYWHLVDICKDSLPSQMRKIIKKLWCKPYSYNGTHSLIRCRMRMSKLNLNNVHDNHNNCRFEKCTIKKHDNTLLYFIAYMIWYLKFLIAQKRLWNASFKSHVPGHMQ